LSPRRPEEGGPAFGAGRAGFRKAFSHTLKHPGPKGGAKRAGLLGRLGGRGAPRSGGGGAPGLGFKGDGDVPPRGAPLPRKGEFRSGAWGRTPVCGACRGAVGGGEPTCSIGSDGLRTREGARGDYRRRPRRGSLRNRVFEDVPIGPLGIEAFSGRASPGPRGGAKGLGLPHPANRVPQGAGIRKGERRGGKWQG